MRPRRISDYESGPDCALSVALIRCSNESRASLRDRIAKSESIVRRSTHTHYYNDKPLRAQIGFRATLCGWRLEAGPSHAQ